MPAPINIALNLVLGSVLAWVLRRSPAMRQELLNWSLLLLLAIEAVLITPMTTYLFRFYPHWSMLYLLDPQVYPVVDDLTGILSLLAVCLNFGAAFLGYWLMRESLLTGKTWQRILPSSLAAVIIVAVFGFCYQQVGLMGDYDDFWQGQARFILLTFAGWLGVLVYGGAAALVTWVHLRFSRNDPQFLG